MKKDEVLESIKNKVEASDAEKTSNLDVLIEVSESEEALGRDGSTDAGDFQPMSIILNY